MRYVQDVLGLKTNLYLQVQFLVRAKFHKLFRGLKYGYV